MHFAVGTEDTYSVSGIVVQNGEPLARASVSIDNNLNYSTITDDNGSFNISDVPKGMHTILVKSSLDDGSFVQNESEIYVNNDILLNSLALPAPVSIAVPDTIDSESIELTWTKSTASDFREYKVYRHTTTGLDETTGTLCYVTVARNDTSFTDQGLDPLTTYYYRVYVMNEYAKLGGSNVVSATTLNRNYILNGSFGEDVDPFLFWNDCYIGDAILDSNVAHSGKYSLRLIMTTEPQEYRNCALLGCSVLENMNIPINKYYKLSLWIKTEGQVESGWIDYIESQYSDIRAGVYDHGCIESFGINGNTDWTYVERVFYFSEEQAEWQNITLGSSSEHAWFDDIKLELYEQP